MYYENRRKFAVLKGLTIKSIIGASAGSEEILIETECGKTFKMHHEQDCCECVSIDSVVGDISDLIGVPILLAEESEGELPPKNEFGYTDESCTWKERLNDVLSYRTPVGFTVWVREDNLFLN